MYTRRITFPDYPFFLFGPRGTGKSTLLRERFPSALWKNLLLDEEYLPLLQEPGLLRSEVEAQPAGSWVVLDEVQRVPALLNEVQDLIARHGSKYRFAMSGSSARKLRRLDVNLLAGRAIELRLFPFVAAELGEEFELTRALTYGTIPTVHSARDLAPDVLSTYVGTYLRQEIQQEALVEDVGAFHRFLRVVGILNGEPVNVSSVSRDALISRTTVERYFEILLDTLVAFRLPGWQPRAKVRERHRPKYYVFDPGVARALAGVIREPLSELEVGKLMETYLLHELRAAQEYQRVGGELFYYRTESGVEVDFIWARGATSVGIEVKSARKWRNEFASNLVKLCSEKLVNRGYVVYRGEKSFSLPNVSVLPVNVFLHKLYEGEIL